MSIFKTLLKRNPERATIGGWLKRGAKSGILNPMANPLINPLALIRNIRKSKKAGAKKFGWKDLLNSR